MFELDLALDSQPASAELHRMGGPVVNAGLNRLSHPTPTFVPVLPVLIAGC